MGSNSIYVNGIYLRPVDGITNHPVTIAPPFNVLVDSILLLADEDAVPDEDDVYLLLLQI